LKPRQPRAAWPRSSRRIFRCSSRESR